MLRLSDFVNVEKDIKIRVGGSLSQLGTLYEDEI